MRYVLSFVVLLAVACGTAGDSEPCPSVRDRCDAGGGGHAASAGQPGMPGGGASATAGGDGGTTAAGKRGLAGGSNGGSDAGGAEHDDAGGDGSLSGGATGGSSAGGNDSATGGSNDNAAAGDGGAASYSWSAPRSLVEDFARLAIGNRVHIVGHTAGQLVHRGSADNGKTWSTADVIAAAAGNFPAMYGGFFAEGDKLFLLTADADMASSADAGGRQLTFRKSVNDGATWGAGVLLTSGSTPLYRSRIAAHDNYVHVVGTSTPTSDASLWYFRSVDGGATWKTPVALAQNLGQYGGGQTVAVDGATVHVAYTSVLNGAGGGPTLYLRSLDNGASWSDPIVIGETSAESSRQARVQLAAADGRVFACWQREGAYTGASVPIERIGYNRSLDGGETWEAAKVLPEGAGVDRNHQHVWMAAGGGVHLLWRHGDSADSTPDGAGYLYSPDYGASWGKRQIAIDTTSSGATNHPWNIVADATAAHVVTGPDGSMQYASLRLP